MSKKQKKQLLSSKEILGLRKKLELSQEQFAQLVRVSSKTISRWETDGVRTDTSSSVQNLLRVKAVADDKAGMKELIKAIKSSGGPTGMGITAASYIVNVLCPVISGGDFGGSIGKSLTSALANIVKSKSRG